MLEDGRLCSFGVSKENLDKESEENQLEELMNSAPKSPKRKVRSGGRDFTASGAPGGGSGAPDGNPGGVGGAPGGGSGAPGDNPGGASGAPGSGSSASASTGWFRGSGAPWEGRSGAPESAEVSQGCGGGRPPLPPRPPPPPAWTHTNEPPATTTSTDKWDDDDDWGEEWTDAWKKAEPKPLWDAESEIYVRRVLREVAPEGLAS